MQPFCSLHFSVWPCDCTASATCHTKWIQSVRVCLRIQQWINARTRIATLRRGIWECTGLFALVKLTLFTSEQKKKGRPRRFEHTIFHRTKYILPLEFAKLTHISSCLNYRVRPNPIYSFQTRSSTPVRLRLSGSCYLQPCPLIAQLPIEQPIVVHQRSAQEP